MTVSSETSKSGPYTGNGVTTSFEITFKVYNAAHVRVVRTVAGVDADVVSGFEVTGITEGTPAVVFVAAPLASEKITIVRNVPRSQELDLVNQGAYFAEDVERSLDLAVMRDQQLQEEIDRCVKLTIGQDPGDLDDLIGDIAALASIRTDVSDLASIKTDIEGVSDIDAKVVIVAENIADVTNFADVYQGPKSAAPTVRNDLNFLHAGDLYFDTSEGRMKVFTGAVWINSASSVNGVLSRYQYVATAAQTTFAAVYDIGFVDVWKNGIKLKSGGVEFTASNGTSVVLTAGAALNDKIEIMAWGAFSLANMLEKSFNLADVPDKASALAILGGQPTNANLSSLAGITLQAGDILYATAANTLVRLAKGTNLQVLGMDATATAPEWDFGAFGGGSAVASYNTTARAINTAYQNTTRKPMAVSCFGKSTADVFSTFQISPDATTWTSIGRILPATWVADASVFLIVPPGWYYRYTGGTPNGTIVEMTG